MQSYNLSQYLTNELPIAKLTDDLTVTINNRYSNMMSIQAMAKEAQGKAADDDKFMKKVLEMLVGKKSAAEIEKMNLPLPEFTKIYQALMHIASGDYNEGNTPS